MTLHDGRAAVPSLHIRPATQADLPCLRELFLRSRRETFVWQPAAAFVLDDFDAQTRDELILVAQDTSGRLVGFISVWEPDAFIHHLFVAPDQLRNGVGRALLHALPGWPHKRYQLKCLSQNHAALAFYRACRFTQMGSGTSQDGDYLLLQAGSVGPT